MKYFAIAFALAACGPSLQSLKLTNATDRPIEEVYVYGNGAANHGASRGAIAPGATMAISVAKGNLGVTAVSAKVKVDAHTNERREASSAVELKNPTEVVFYDEANKPANLGRDGVIGASFTTDKTAPPEPAQGTPPNVVNDPSAPPDEPAK